MSTAHQLASETPLILSACVKISRSASGDWKDALARARHRGAVDARGVGVCAGICPRRASPTTTATTRPVRRDAARRHALRELAQRGGKLCARCHGAKAVLKRLAGKENATQTAAPKKRAAGAARRARRWPLSAFAVACQSRAAAAEAAGGGSEDAPLWPRSAGRDSRQRGRLADREEGRDHRRDQEEVGHSRQGGEWRDARGGHAARRHLRRRLRRARALRGARAQAVRQGESAARRAAERAAAAAAASRAGRAGRVGRAAGRRARAQLRPDDGRRVFAPAHARDRASKQAAPLGEDEAAAMEIALANSLVEQGPRSTEATPPPPPPPPPPPSAPLKKHAASPRASSRARAARLPLRAASEHRRGGPGRRGDRWTRPHRRRRERHVRGVGSSGSRWARGSRS